MLFEVSLYSHSVTGESNLIVNHWVGKALSRTVNLFYPRAHTKEGGKERQKSQRDGRYTGRDGRGEFGGRGMSVSLLVYRSIPEV